MPLAARIYTQYIGSEYVGYTVFGAGILIIGNLILLVRAWALAFDKGFRERYLKED